MNKQILKIALGKFKKLQKKYKKFRNVFVDDWRGMRFVFDTEDVKNCNNDCKNCSLCKLVGEDKDAEFFKRLYLAFDKDKKLFGPQNYLNCKTIDQYADCYANFLINETNTEPEIFDELDLIKNCKLIYSKDGNVDDTEYYFKKSIIDKVLKNVSSKKVSIIKKYLSLNGDFFI